MPHFILMNGFCLVVCILKFLKEGFKTSNFHSLQWMKKKRREFTWLPTSRRKACISRSGREISSNSVGGWEVGGAVGLLIWREELAWCDDSFLIDLDEDTLESSLSLVNESEILLWCFFFEKKGIENFFFLFFRTRRSCTLSSDKSSYEWKIEVRRIQVYNSLIWLMSFFLC